MQPIHLKFTHTEAEYLAATRLLLFGQKVLLARMVVIMALVMFLSFALAVVGEFELWAALALGMLFNVSVFYMAIVDAPRRVFRKDSKFRDEYALTFSEEGIALKTHQIDSKLAWSLYKQVLENKSLYVLVYDAPGRMVMTVVPKRVFRDATEELEFRGLVHRKVDQSLALTTDSISDQPYTYVPSKLEPPDWR
jgi:YcxB-like protein